MIISDLYNEINNDTIIKSLLQIIFGIGQKHLEVDMNLFEKPPSPSKRKKKFSEEQEKLILNFIFLQNNSYTPFLHQYIICFFDN